MEETPPSLQAGSKPHLEKLTLGVTRILGECGGKWLERTTEKGWGLVALSEAGPDCRGHRCLEFHS